MSSFRIRPRFKHLINERQHDLEQRICLALQEEKQFIYSHLPGHLYIKIHPAHQHFWSPQLHLTLEEQEEQVLVRGLYGPNPTVWAIFFFGYIIIGLLALFLGMYGLSLWSLGKDVSILWSIPALGVLALILYLASQAGQKFAAQQMFDIHHFYERVTKDKVYL